MENSEHISSDEDWKDSRTVPQWNSSRAERSEEHTSELQSRGQLVCRLPLEKKKEGPLAHLPKGPAYTSRPVQHGAAKDRPMGKAGVVEDRGRRAGTTDERLAARPLV